MLPLFIFCIFSTYFMKVGSKKDDLINGNKTLIKDCNENYQPKTL